MTYNDILLTYFAQHLGRSGFALPAFSQRVAEGESQMKPLTAWLKSLSKPVGILTFDDKLGERVLTACRWSDLPVPDLVAVLGIGNDDLVSKLTWPSLSSINVPAERIGFEAADILDHAMRRRRIKRPRRKLPPTGVTMREGISEDPHLIACLADLACPDACLKTQAIKEVTACR